MIKKINAVIFIHGITTELDPPEPVGDLYQPMWKSLASHIPGFEATYWLPIFVKWGNVFPGDAKPFRPDQKLSLAEKQLSALTTKKVQALPGSTRLDTGWPGIRKNLEGVRDRLMRGLADGIYYSSAEGERHVRQVVYGQVLNALKPQLRAGYEVRLHIIAHSLGNAIAHDFLYGIFNSRKDPDFAKGPVSNKAHRRTYRELRELSKGRGARVSFGSFSSMASPMPFFVVRNQSMVNLLAKKGRLDASQIGIRVKQRDLQWKVFYDKYDLLAFPTRNLYRDPNGSIGDYNVSTGWLPLSAHLGYWGNKDVRRETAELLSRRRI